MKYKTEYEIQVNYGGYGFETVFTADTLEDAKQIYKDYVDNVQAYGLGVVRMKRKVIRI